MRFGSGRFRNCMSPVTMTRDRGRLRSLLAASCSIFGEYRCHRRADLRLGLPGKSTACPFDAKHRLAGGRIAQIDDRGTDALRACAVFAGLHVDVGPLQRAVGGQHLAALASTLRTRAASSIDRSTISVSDLTARVATRSTNTSSPSPGQRSETLTETPLAADRARPRR